MDGWLRIAAGIDALTRAVARIAQWALLANALLVAGNAIIRKLFNVSALVIFDLQWHFFAAIVLLMAAYTLQRNEHVRVDVLAPRLGERGLAWLDLLGIFLVLLPLCLFMTWLGRERTLLDRLRVRLPERRTFLKKTLHRFDSRTVPKLSRGETG